MTPLSNLITLLSIIAVLWIVYILPTPAKEGFEIGQWTGMRTPVRRGGSGTSSSGTPSSSKTVVLPSDMYKKTEGMTEDMLRSLPVEKVKTMCTRFFEQNGIESPAGWTPPATDQTTRWPNLLHMDKDSAISWLKTNAPDKTVVPTIDDGSALTADLSFGRIRVFYNPITNKVSQVPKTG